MPTRPAAMKNSLRRLCVITPDSSDIHALIGELRVALEAGVRWVQFRKKNGPGRQLYYEAREIRKLTCKYGALFIVNDFADIALAVEADGLHVGQDDMPLAEARKLMVNRIVGVSTHNLSEANEAERGGADYIGFGPIFQTLTKETGSPQGPESLEKIADSVSIPVIAIGGITVDNSNSVLSAGSYGIAVSSGIFRGQITANVTGFLYNIIRLKGGDKA